MLLSVKCLKKMLTKQMLKKKKLQNDDKGTCLSKLRL